MNKAKKQQKLKEKRRTYEKKRNQNRIQRRSLNKIIQKTEKQIRRLMRFVEEEDPKTLWTTAQRKSIAKLLEEKIKDPRKKRGVRHQMKDILILLIYASLCGKKTYEEIAAWVKEREDIFTVELGLLHGVPSASTFDRAMQMVSFEQFHSVFREWCLRHIPVFKYLIKDELKLHFCTDGKAIRALTKKHLGQKHPPYMLNAYLYSPKFKAGFCVASFPIDKKTNEAKALGPFLKQFVLKDSIVTIDAAGAYQESVDVILNAGAQALICLKGNQKNLEKEAQKEIQRARQELQQEREAIESFEKMTGYRQKLSGLFSDYSEENPHTHGRYEKRDYLFSNDPICIDREAWPQIQGIGSVERTRKIIGYKQEELIVSQESQKEIHYYFSTVKLTAQTFAGLARRHWHIESRLHGILDGPAFLEDRSRMRVGEAMQNMAIVRRFSYNLLELLYLEMKPEKRPSFLIREHTINERDSGMEEILFKEKSCLPQ